MIRYAIVDCLFGRMLLAKSDEGVCALSFGATVRELTEYVQEQFPEVELQRADGELQTEVKSALARLADPDAPWTHPLHLVGTEFQRKVWNALCKIPTGKTWSYAEVAKKIGKPKAVRAVGTACGANPVALIVPCHRVIGTDGKLHGYRGGLPIKEKLLAMEAAPQPKTKNR